MVTEKLTSQAEPRIALYSHDTLGLGHVRRNLVIAHALQALDPSPALLLVSGTTQSLAFRPPSGADFLTLPGVSKTDAGGYAPRSLATDLGHLLTLRSATLAAALAAFRPHLFIVDKVPRGVLGELQPALSALGSTETRMVLGLRDILDAPAAARTEWHASGATEEVVRRFDEVWVYGDPAVANVLADCALPMAVRRKTRFTGYLAPPLRSFRPSPERHLVLCVAGGGQDGFEMCAAFLDAPLPAGLQALVVTGPFMPLAQRDELTRRAARTRNRSVVDFVDDLSLLLDQAAAVVAMGGYNTTMELLASRVPALLIPRDRPRAEQLTRAQRLSALGLVSMLEQQQATPEAIGEWLARRPIPPSGAVDLDGTRRIPEFATALLQGSEAIHVA